MSNFKSNTKIKRIKFPYTSVLHQHKRSNCVDCDKNRVFMIAVLTEIYCPFLPNISLYEK